MQCLRTPVKTELLELAVDTAARATSDKKIRLLSQLLCSGAMTDDLAMVDEQLVAAGAIAALDPPHLRLLEILLQSNGKHWDDAQVQKELEYAWSLRQIAERDAGLAIVLPALIARLQAHGLIYDVSVGRLGVGEQLWHATSFGRLCAGEMLRIGKEET